ncbi:MAG: GNAT family N-acetyltransferase [Gammaproteobacteria bacterium]|nr:GNAT family N-acetyltransferase [Gammaproteobacteria bacterium]
MNVIIAHREYDGLAQEDLQNMHRLRYRVFRQRLNWEVCGENEQELDSYDLLNPVYLLVRDGGNSVIGSWRMLPTTGPNMLRDTFPELLDGAGAPLGNDIWELSRFATESNDRGHVAGYTSAVPFLMMQAAYTFAVQNDIRRYVTVTNVALERMLRRLGVNVVRLGNPRQIGVERAVALSIEIDDITHAALFSAAYACIDAHHPEFARSAKLNSNTSMPLSAHLGDYQPAPRQTH